jgi:hypothetical protein
LRQQSEAERGEQILSQYKKAFVFSNEERLMLDGVILEPSHKS